MIGLVRTWLAGVSAAAFLTSLTQSLVPEGTVRKLSALAGGMLLLVAITKPLLGTDFEGWKLDYEEYSAQIRQRQEQLQQENDQQLEALIARKTQAYILDKADALGEECSVRVLVERGEEGVLLPVGAEFGSPPSQALAEYLEGELGIPRERQVVHETG